jgi:hypothetical protein
MGGASSVSKPSENGGREHKQTGAEARPQSHSSLHEHTTSTQLQVSCDTSKSDDREDDRNGEAQGEFMSHEEDHVLETPRSAAAANAAAADIFAQMAMSL